MKEVSLAEVRANIQIAPLKLLSAHHQTLPLLLDTLPENVAMQDIQLRCRGKTVDLALNMHVRLKRKLKWVIHAIFDQLYADGSARGTSRLRCISIELE